MVGALIRVEEPRKHTQSQDGCLTMEIDWSDVSMSYGVPESGRSLEVPFPTGFRGNTNLPTP